MTHQDMPVIAGIGGTTRCGSTSERALRYALGIAADAGARTKLLTATDLQLPMYTPERSERTEKAVRLVEALAQADGLIISSPGYHGGISGLLKNALDYAEDLREAEPPYLHNRVVGCIVTAYGWQATATTLVALRGVVHALRAWPTPLGVAINSAERVFLEDGSVAEPAATNLAIMAAQVVGGAALHRTGTTPGV